MNDSELEGYAKKENGEKKLKSTPSFTQVRPHKLQDYKIACASRLRF